MLEFFNNINYKALLCTIGIILFFVLGAVFPFFGCIIITIICIATIVGFIWLLYSLFDELLD